MNIGKFKSGLLTAALFAATLAAGSSASAATAVGNLSVTANVAANCKVSTSPVAFGAIDPLTTGTVNAAGTLVLNCVKGTSVTNITLGAGGGPTGSFTRGMTNAATSDKLGYDLYVPASTAPNAACAYTKKWDASAAVFAPGTSTSNAAVTYNVCGQSSNGQDVSTGNYSDTVPFTVNF